MVVFTATTMDERCGGGGGYNDGVETMVVVVIENEAVMDT